MTDANEVAISKILSIRSAIDVIVAVSPQGLYLLEPQEWHVLFYSALWDIDLIKYISGRDGDDDDEGD